MCDILKEFVVTTIIVIVVMISVIIGTVSTIMLINRCVNTIPCKVFLKDKIVSEQPLYLTEVKASGDTTTVIIFKSWLQLGKVYQISDKNLKVNCEK